MTRVRDDDVHIPVEIFLYRFLTQHIEKFSFAFCPDRADAVDLSQACTLGQCGQITIKEQEIRLPCLFKTAE